MWRAISRSSKAHEVPVLASVRVCCTNLNKNSNAGAEKGGDACSRSSVKGGEQVGRFSIEVLIYYHNLISGLPKSAVQMQSMKEASPFYTFSPGNPPGLAASRLSTHLSFSFSITMFSFLAFNS